MRNSVASISQSSVQESVPVSNNSSKCPDGSVLNQTITSNKTSQCNQSIDDEPGDQANTQTHHQLPLVEIRSVIFDFKMSGPFVVCWRRRQFSLDQV
jgi:hypothetical protein